MTSIEDVRRAEPVIRAHVSPTPLIRSYALERELGFPASRRVWLKDYGWTPVGSFKLMGALNWMEHLCRNPALADRPVAAHSSGNFASGLAFAGRQYGRRVIIVMPETAPAVKFERTRAWGAEIRTYDIHRDHETGQRDKLTREIADHERAVQASPYDDPQVIAGNGVGRSGRGGATAPRGSNTVDVSLPGERRRTDGRAGIGDRRRFSRRPNRGRGAGWRRRLFPVARGRCARRTEAAHEHM